MEVKLQLVGAHVRLSDEHGTVGIASGDELLAATLLTAEALAARCPPDPQNAALNDLAYSRRLIVAQFPSVAALLRDH